MTLIEALQRIPDYRHARGKRHPLWIILVTIVMGNLAGYWGNRPLETFARRYGDEIAKLLQIDIEAMPSYSTFRRAQLSLDFDAFSDAFRTWMSQYHDVDDDSYAIDGKRIRQPMIGADGKQRFIGLVSVFSQQRGITVELAGLSETENSEIKVVQYLCEQLQLTGAVLTLDAAHTQKNAEAYA